MKNIYRLKTGLILLMFSIHSCEDKPTPPVTTTTAVTEISYTSATSGGDVTSEGGAPIVSRGICWSNIAEPTISNSKTNESGGLGVFISNLTQLAPNTLYYVRAYATNAEGTGYGNILTFTTLKIETASLTTTEVTSITQTSAISGGNITNENGGPVLERGVCCRSANPTTENIKTNEGAEQEVL